MTHPTQLLQALAKARAAMPTLERNDSGYDGEDQIFTFPKEEDLRDNVALVFAEFQLLEVIGDAVASTGFLATTWTLHHLPSGESITHQITWPIDGDRKMSRPHAAAAAWSHAWRHFMTKLLSIRVKARKASPAAPPAGECMGAAYRAAGVRNIHVGGCNCPGCEAARALPLWADTPDEAPRPRATERPPAPVDTSRDAAWAPAGAVVDEPAPAPAPVEQHGSTFDVWGDLCAAMRKAGAPKRWEFVIEAWREYSGRPGDVLAPEDDGFKTWLKGQVSEWIKARGTT